MDVVTTEPTSVMLGFPNLEKVEATADMGLLESGENAEELARKQREAQQNAAMALQNTNTNQTNQPSNTCDECCECFADLCSIFLCNCDDDGGDSNNDTSLFCGDCDCDCDCSD